MVRLSVAQRSARDPVGSRQAMLRVGGDRGTVPAEWWNGALEVS
jgi:hypothetical protein